MKRTLIFGSGIAIGIACLAGVAGAFADATGTPVYDSIPAPTPPNVPSLGFQATQTAEFGDEIRLDPDTPRRAGYATVLMSDWAKHSTYPAMDSNGFMHNVTLNL